MTQKQSIQHQVLHALAALHKEQGRPVSLGELSQATGLTRLVVSTQLSAMTFHSPSLVERVGRESLPTAAGLAELSLSRPERSANGSSKEAMATDETEQLVEQEDTAAPEPQAYRCLSSRTERWGTQSWAFRMVVNVVEEMTEHLGRAPERPEVAKVLMVLPGRSLNAAKSLITRTLRAGLLKEQKGGGLAVVEADHREDH